MSKDLHVYTGGLDPFVFFVGSVQVHVHAGSPGRTTPESDPTEAGHEPPRVPTPLKLTPLKPPYEATIVTMPDDAADMRAAIEEMVLPGVNVELVLRHGGAKSAEPAQLDAVLSGLSDSTADDVSLYLFEASEETDG